MSKSVPQPSWIFPQASGSGGKFGPVRKGDSLVLNFFPAIEKATYERGIILFCADASVSTAVPMSVGRTPKDVAPGYEWVFTNTAQTSEGQKCHFAFDGALAGNAVQFQYFNEATETPQTFSSGAVPSGTMTSTLPVSTSTRTSTRASTTTSSTSTRTSSSSARSTSSSASSTSSSSSITSTTLSTSASQTTPAPSTSTTDPAAAAAAAGSSNKSSGLSAGASAGIGVGVALGVLLIIAAVAFFILSRRRRRRKEIAAGVAALPLKNAGAGYYAGAPPGMVQQPQYYAHTAASASPPLQHAYPQSAYPQSAVSGSPTGQAQGQAQGLGGYNGYQAGAYAPQQQQPPQPVYEMGSGHGHGHGRTEMK